ncbi:MAG: alanine racemase, partial [Candidatus Hodarchaeales archaeon]
MLKNVSKPTLILDETKTKANIKNMTEKIKISKKIFRPHFKTHQSNAIGQWFKEVGVDKITVSSIAMANYFKQNFSDITIAIPVNIRQITEINKIATKTKINLVLENIGTAKILEKDIVTNTDIYIEIDVDYGRSGISWKNSKKLANLANYIDKANNLELAGILTHAGQTYNARNVSEIKDIYHETSRKMQSVKKSLEELGLDNLIVSVGDTPSASVIENFNEVDELRPGNFVFYDLTQYSLGVCKEDQISIAVACPVIAKYSTRNEIVIYGGAVHLSKDYFEIDYNNAKVKC